MTYDSAHLAQGRELVIRSGHDGYDKPETIAFLKAELLDWARGFRCGPVGPRRPYRMKSFAVSVSVPVSRMSKSATPSPLLSP